MIKLEAIDGLFFSNCGPCGLGSLHIRANLSVGSANPVEYLIRLDQIEGLGDDIAALTGTHLNFPINPEPGYIDGSIYIHSRHRSVDVTTLHFTTVSAATIALRVEATLDLNLDDSDVGFAYSADFYVPIHLPLTNAQLTDLVASAVIATQARVPRDFGKLMSYLKNELHYSSQLGAAAALAKAALAAL